MSLLFTFISLAAIIVLSAFSVKFLKIPSGIAPVSVVCFIMLYFSLLGCFNLLLLGGWIFFAFCLASLYLCITKYSKEDYGKLFSPSFLIFCALSILVLLLFAYKKPIYVNWDEFSFWGTAIKITKSTNTLYTTAEIGWPWAATQKPGLPMLGYFFEFFGSYEEWRAIFATNVVYFACFSAVISGVSNKKWHISVPCVLLCFLMPYAFVHYRSFDFPSFVYTSVLSDIPMGVLFGTALCVFYALRRKKAPLYPVFILLAALTFTRDTALPLALIAAGIMVIDAVFCEKQFELFSLKQKTAKLVFSISAFAIPVIFFVFWVFYLKLALNVDAAGNVGSAQPMSMFGMLIEGTKQFFGIGVTENYTAIMNNMYTSFWRNNLTAIGSGVRVVAVILSMVACAAFLSKDRLHRLRCILFGVVSSLGFFAFYVFTGWCYVFIFKDFEASVLISYERYIYPYYIGWFLAALCLLAITASSKHQNLYGACGSLIFVLILVFAVKLNNIITPGLSFIDYNKGYMYSNYEYINKATQIQNQLGDTKDKIFFVSQGDDGGKWFMYSCQMLPLQLDYSYGGGTICLPQDVPKGTFYHIRITKNELSDYLIKNNCKYVFVENINDGFVNNYGSLFSDNLKSCENGKDMLYTVSESMGTAFMQPLKEIS